MNASQCLRIYEAAIAQMAARKSLMLEKDYIDSAISAEGLSPEVVAAEARRLLRTSADELSTDEIEALLMFAGDCTEFDDGISTYNALLQLKNHTRHEDIAQMIQDAANPSSIPALVSTLEAEHELAPRDEGKALARKCFWALAAIGTEEAWQVIKGYENSDDPILLRWANEQVKRCKS